jgi:hypothetical protein
MNAHIDYRYKTSGGAWLQHLSRLPGDITTVYTSTKGQGVLNLKDGIPHQVRIEVRDASQNQSVLSFSVQYDPDLPKPPSVNLQRWMPQQVNIFEQADFEAFSTERTLYDTVSITFSSKPGTVSSSPLFSFLHAALPSHDNVIVRIKPNFPIANDDRNKMVIKSVSGSKTVIQKASWQGDWIWTKFRQFGTYQAFVDNIPPVINTPPTNLRSVSRIVFTPTDNFNTISFFRAEVDGQWLRFTNDKGRTWIYTFDEYFPAGEHQLKVTVADEAGNITEKVWTVNR